MDTARIVERLGPFLADPLAAGQLENISTYIDILLRWNQKVNLTAVRDPEQIVTRHFGESIFAARQLFAGTAGDLSPKVVDVGSGAGFPGIPIKLCYPELRVTLVEANQKKAIFLREVIRGLALTGIDVFASRAEDFPVGSADIVTMRAVERFESALSIAARLVNPRGCLALLIGQGQVIRAAESLPKVHWMKPIPIPKSSSRVLLVGSS